MKQKGASFVEFIIVFPLLLILIGGLIDIGSVLFQVVISTDATRMGARKAALYALQSAPVTECTDLMNLANEATSQYMLNTLKIPQQQWEIEGGTASICDMQSETMDRPFSIITQKVRINESITKTCLFCFLEPLTRLAPVASSSYIIPGGCCFGFETDPNSPFFGACLDIPQPCIPIDP